MAINDRKGILVILGVVGIVFVLSAYSAGFSRIEGSGLCEFCHMTYYDYREYAYNPKSASSKPQGVLFGCAECHRNPFREFKNSDHSKTDDMDRRPGCPNCHKPHSLVTTARYMFTTSPFLGVTDGMMIGDHKWEKTGRLQLAREVREGFLREDSKTCKGCHKDMNTDLEPHQIARKEKMTCIECHFNLVHKETPWPEMEAKKERLGID